MLDGLPEKGSLFLNLSGGKDSAVAASVAVDLVRRSGKDLRIVAIHAYTPLALEENLSYVERLARWLGVELIVVEPDPRFGLERVATSGWPSPLRRWCMYKWKLEPLIKATKHYPAPWIHVLGVRRSESRRRFTVFDGRSQDRPWFYCLKYVKYCSYYWAPILDWSSEDVWRYIEEKGLPRNPLWRRHGHSSHDCVVCIAFAGKKEYLWLKAAYPDVWEKLYKVYREMNRNKRREKKILAWHYTDLDEIARMPTLEDFARPSRAKCVACILPSEPPAGRAGNL